MNSYGEFLAYCRKVKGLSQTQVAEILGYESGQIVSDWECNISQPPILVIGELARIYDSPRETFFNYILEGQISEITTNQQNVFTESGKIKKAMKSLQ
ncbi:helix-turn-helix domain-containing protein [Bdellovibrio sp. HCB288]|uniref:helix-turn-helix domain-containing protein n=1 Tax=Bdellovibrio sp. HCB288 TaxID=3394355 RepID=UPI0039B65BB0